MKYPNMLLVSFLTLQFNTLFAASLYVTAPDSSVKWCYSKTYKIRWDKTGQMSDQVGITLFNGNTNSVKRIIAMSVPNNGVYSWKVDVNDFKAYKIQVAVRPTSQHPANVKGKSALFYIRDCRKPDLRVTSVIEGLASGRVAPHFKELVYKVTIKNHGDAKAGPSKTRMTISGPNSSSHDWQTPELAPNASHVHTFKYKINGGRYYNRAQADIGNMVGEVNEANNVTTTSRYKVVQPDLVPCIYKRNNVVTNVKSSVEAEIRNIGTLTAPPSRACIWVKKKRKRCFYVPRIYPGKKFVIRRRMRWFVVGTLKYYAEVDTSKVVKESNENNNKIYGMIIKRRKYVSDQNSRFRCARK